MEHVDVLEDVLDDGINMSLTMVGHLDAEQHETESAVVEFLVTCGHMVSQASALEK